MTDNEYVGKMAKLFSLVDEEKINEVQKLMVAMLNDSFVKGLKAGKSNGFKEGFKEGYDKGFDDGTQKGYDEGMEDGYRSGRRAACYD